MAAEVFQSYYLYAMRPKSTGLVDLPQSHGRVPRVLFCIRYEQLPLLQFAAEMIHLSVDEHWCQMLNGDAVSRIFRAECCGEAFDVTLQQLLSKLLKSVASG